MWKNNFKFLISSTRVDSLISWPFEMRLYCCISCLSLIWMTIILRLLTAIFTYCKLDCFGFIQLFRGVASFMHGPCCYHCVTLIHSSHPYTNTHSDCSAILTLIVPSPSCFGRWRAWVIIVSAVLCLPFSFIASLYSSYSPFAFWITFKGCFCYVFNSHSLLFFQICHSILIVHARWSTLDCLLLVPVIAIHHALNHPCCSLVPSHWIGAICQTSLALQQFQ